MSMTNTAAIEMTPEQELGLKLRYAAEKGRLHEVRKLLVARAPILRDPNGLNALHKAAKHGHAAVVKQLISSRQINPNQADKYGWSPLHWAAWNGHIGVINALINSNRCNVNTVDKSGSNALHCAAINGHSNVIRVLVPVKCDPNLQRKDSWTPLHLACWNGHYDVVQELIEAKCKINVKTEDGMGPLHLAAVKGFDEIIRALLEAGVAPDMQDKHGNTALHEATRWHHLSSVQLLMKMDCRINVRNLEGERPMDIARKEGQNNIVSELSGLGLSIHNLEESYGHEELKKLLFEESMSKFDKLKNPKWISEEENGRNSTDSGLSIESWERKLESAKAEVMAKYESRIQEVERYYKKKVNLMEQQCSRHLNTASRQQLSDSAFDRSPSAPDQPTFGAFPHPLSFHRVPSL